MNFQRSKDEGAWALRRITYKWVLGSIIYIRPIEFGWCIKNDSVMHSKDKILHDNVIAWQCHCVTISLHDNVNDIAQQCHCVTMSLHDNVTEIQCGCVTISLCDNRSHTYLYILLASSIIEIKLKECVIHKVGRTRLHLRTEDYTEKWVTYKSMPHQLEKL